MIESYPIQVTYSPSNAPEINIDVNLQGVDQTNLTEIQQIVQTMLETISDIVTIDNDDSQLINADSDMVDQVLAQDLLNGPCQRTAFRADSVWFI